jgi:hypothetical protein
VVVLTGGRNGLNRTYQAEVAPGRFPGPVYPKSLAKRQRAETAWAAGRKWKSRASFGFKPAVDSVQSGNTSEYLLRGPDRRLYRVTPLTPSASRSQAFIAYAVSPADTVTAGRLNPLDVYVLPDGDQRIANLNTLTNKATDAVRGTDPTFLNTGGKLEEFIPLGGDMWRVYGVRRGLTEFYVDLSIVGRVQPKTVTLTQAPVQKQPASACAEPPAQMTETEIADCMSQLAAELRRRSSQAPR